MAKVWDQYEFKIAEHYLSALINDDTSGLDGEDEKAFEAWAEQCKECAVADGFTVGHWSAEDSFDDWGQCAVSGLLAMRCEVTLHVYREVPDSRTQHHTGETHRYERTKSVESPMSAARLTYRPDWSESQPWVSYINGTAGRHFTTLAEGETYLSERGFTRF